MFHYVNVPNRFLNPVFVCYIYTEQRVCKKKHKKRVSLKSGAGASRGSGGQELPPSRPGRWASPSELLQGWELLPTVLPPSGAQHTLGIDGPVVSRVFIET